jgi:hypothetical protein
MSAFFATMIKVDGMSAIEIGLLRDKGRLRIIKNTLVVLAEAEGVAVLAESVDVRVAGQIGPQAHILLLEDKWHSRGVEENLTVVSTLDSEGEGLLHDVELKNNIGSRRGNIVVLGAWQDVLMDLENLKSCIEDFDVEAFVCED